MTCIVKVKDNLQAFNKCIYGMMLEGYNLHSDGISLSLTENQKDYDELTFRDKNHYLLWLLRWS